MTLSVSLLEHFVLNRTSKNAVRTTIKSKRKVRKPRYTPYIYNNIYALAEINLAKE